jgi:transposase
MSNVRFFGLDVHAETIAVAVAESNGEVRSLGTIPNRPESIGKLMKKLGPAAHLRVCYEAGPTGYVVYRQLTVLGVKCEVVAPTLVPVKAGDRVKTDRRDALRLARSYRAGDLTAVWVPDAAHESPARSGPRAGGGEEGFNFERAIAWVNFCCGMAATADGDERVDAGPPGVGEERGPL